LTMPGQKSKWSHSQVPSGPQFTLFLHGAPSAARSRLPTALFIAGTARFSIVVTNLNAMFMPEIRIQREKRRNDGDVGKLASWIFAGLGNPRR
jgi:hypothetical protein